MRAPTLLLLAISNTPFFAQTLNYYFGNLHSHTAYSDGNKDSVATGINTPSKSYAYAKLSEDFDFLGISEHNHFSSPKNPGFRRHLYQPGLAEANAANDDGNFVALFGMEYGVSSDYNGHVLIYGYNQLLGWETSAPGVTGANYEVFNSKTDYKGLFTKIRNTPGAFCYLAHPSFGDFSTEGTWETSLANAPYNADFDSVIVGLPLRSGLANSMSSSYDDYPVGDYFNYYKKMLYNGYHVGIGYDHDNHQSNFGRSNGGRLVVLAPSLTRANLFKAMKQRNFYGSDDRNARVAFTVNGHIMGTITKIEGDPVISVTHNDPDSELADTIKIWKGRANSGGLWAWITHTTVNTNAASYEDKQVSQGYEYYYFAEIRQKDGQWMMTSPVWVTIQEGTAIEPISDIPPTVFYQPQTEAVHFAFFSGRQYTVSIYNLSGRLIISQQSDEQQIRIVLSEFPDGMYFYKIAGDKIFTGKLVK